MGAVGLPETIRQAKRWDQTKQAYLNEGLCHRCAAHAAWGHQNNAGGRTKLPAPCVGCAPRLRDFPVPTTSSLWRKFDRPQDLIRSLPALYETRLNSVEDREMAVSDQESVA
ncbi:hypothetical protein YM3MPS_55050 [Mycobacterium pseudoshottsii]|uniref:Uncharacterized protein n=1 Tax=Mycobacterium pseudoshottsii TaxID=265949 RepID=A0A9N7LXW5_9MYCO|nr:hypothetical protein [Mycobacterium pseudoshottsii]RFZ57755.1 hypothetical protein DL240490_04745 [Mycobacterium marinum]BBA90815.1 hypothetical protein MPSD_55890 [Mycobacterium pseudoshottsii JCM 15466]BDN85322.1 hypothetical protein NJB1907Z4_C55370 [Mycobacterium pseudoshottsii]BEH79702.1 hypothetical protein YM3MPS_55050 [Mycobacterium pseudoshottsii]